MIQTGEAEAGGGQALLILGCVIVVNLDVMVGQRQAAKLDAPSVLLANSKMMKERLPAKHVPRESLLEPLVQQSVQVRDKFVLFCCSFVRFVYWLFFLFFLRDSAHLFFFSLNILQTVQKVIFKIQQEIGRAKSVHMASVVPLSHSRFVRTVPQASILLAHT